MSIITEPRRGHGRKENQDGLLRDLAKQTRDLVKVLRDLAKVLAAFFGGRQLEADWEVEARCAGKAVFLPAVVGLDLSLASS